VRWGRRLALLALALSLPSLAPAKATRTFDLHVTVYCHPPEAGDPFL
jgi:hypothetical protein